MSYRILLGSVAALAFLSACKFDVAESTYSLGDALSFEVERGIAGDPGFSSGPEPGNPISCLSAPDNWSVSAPDVTLQSTAPDATIPPLMITPQPAQAGILQTELPRDGFSWHCYSAFNTPQTLTQNMYGVAKHQITAVPIGQMVRLITTIGNKAGNFRDGLAFHDVHAGTLPDTNAPQRLTVSDQITAGTLRPLQQLPRWDAVTFNDRLIISTPASPDVTVLSANDNDVSVHTARPAGSASQSLTTVTDTRIARPYISHHLQAAVFTSEDAVTWTSADTGLTLTAGETPLLLHYEGGANRWVLFTHDAEADDDRSLSSYFMSDQDADRFTVTSDGPVLALQPAGFIANVSPTLVGTDMEGLKLATFRNGEWQYERLSSTLTDIDEVNGVFHDGRLYLAVTTPTGTALYRYQPGSGTDMTLLLSRDAAEETAHIVSLFSDQTHLLVIQNDSLLLSSDEGDTWATIFDITKLPLYRDLPDASLEHIHVEHLSASEVLISTQLSATGYSDQRLTLKLDLDGADARLIAGQAGSSGSSPIQNLDHLWTHVGTLENRNYRLAHNHNGKMEAEALNLQAGESSETPENNDGASGGSSGGGGSLPLVLLAALLLAIRRR